tara:strand:- start:120 stop:833 length:714 start_codon:yes stop_codon:yes gene_type:complete
MTPNREEKLVIDNLSHQGYENILFEPDGNLPPDILVDNKIAIEVRRLNQNQKTENGFKGLEQDEFSIHGILTRIMKEVSDENYDKSAFVGYYFNRPVPSKNEIKTFAKEVLENHKSSIDEGREYDYNEFFRMRVFPSEIKLDQQYEYGMSRDGDSGGFIVSLIYENLKLIVAEKENKTKNHRNKYSKWWLAVVDTIGYGLSDLDLNQFNELPKIENQFDRLLLVSAIDYKTFRYLYE